MERIEEQYDYYPEERLEELIQYGYNFNMSQYFKRGFEIFGQNVGGFVGYTFLYFIIIGVSFFTIVGPALLAPALGAGFLIMAKKIDKNEHFEFNTFFKGFDRFAQLLLVSLVTGFFVGLGSILSYPALMISESFAPLFALPSIYLGIAFSLSASFVIFMKKDFWEAMTYSIKIVNKNFFSFLLFFLVVGLITAVGALFFGVGLLFTIPLASCMLYAAYEDIIGVGDSLEDNIEAIYDDYDDLDSFEDNEYRY